MSRDLHLERQDCTLENLQPPQPNTISDPPKPNTISTERVCNIAAFMRFLGYLCVCWVRSGGCVRCKHLHLMKLAIMVLGSHSFVFFSWINATFATWLWSWEELRVSKFTPSTYEESKILRLRSFFNPFFNSSSSSSCLCLLCKRSELQRSM